MPLDPHGFGQQITFASQRDPDQKYTQYVYVYAKANQTIAEIAAIRGRPDMVQEILKLNRGVKLSNGHYLRSAATKLRANQKIRLPGTLTQLDAFSVLCGENRPIVKDGYARYDTVDRPGRVGLNRFLGYNPIEIDVDVQFEAYSAFDGTEVERAIEKLERMAGRGSYGGAADGAPSVVGVTVTDNSGHIVPLIGLNYQWSPSNPSAPLYRIGSSSGGGIAWKGGDLSDDAGRRVRALATITIRQYTPLTLVKRSVAQRAKAKASSKAKK